MPQGFRLTGKKGSRQKILAFAVNEVLYMV